MSDDNEEVTTTVVKTVDPVKELETLKGKLAEAETLLEKARKGETHNRNARKELETKLAALEDNEFQSKYEQTAAELEQLKGTLKTQAIDTALMNAAKEAGAKDLKAILKLVDKASIEVVDGVADAKAIEAEITKAKGEYSVLFETPKTPDVKRAGEGNVTDSFKNEMKAAKTQADMVAVMNKYGIGHTI